MDFKDQIKQIAERDLALQCSTTQNMPNGEENHK